MNFTKEEYEAWRNHPCTQAVVEELHAATENIKIRWADGGYTEESVEGTIQRNNQALGFIQGLEAIEEFLHTMGDQ